MCVFTMTHPPSFPDILAPWLRDLLPETQEAVREDPESCALCAIHAPRKQRPGSRNPVFDVPKQRGWFLPPDARSKNKPNSKPSKQNRTRKEIRHVLPHLAKWRRWDEIWRWQKKLVVIKTVVIIQSCSPTCWSELGQTGFILVAQPSPNISQQQHVYI